jgi:ABC-type nitrate/sulfonate/bicarbonate transport system permease component
MTARNLLETREHAAGAPAAGAPRVRRMPRAALTALGMVLTFILLWESGVRLLHTPVYLLPAPSRVIVTLVEHPALFARASLVTLSEALLGLLVGLTASALLAALLMLRPGLADGVMTLAILVKSTPLVAIAPLLTLWLGFGMLPKVLIVALMTFFPLLVNLLSGLQQIDPALLDVFRSWNASRKEIFLHLRVPSALPFLFAGIKISAPLALVGAVVAEWTGASGGLGREMWLAYTNLNLPFLFGGIFILAAAGALLYRMLDVLERRALFWQTARAADS